MVILIRQIILLFSRGLYLLSKKPLVWMSTVRAYQLEKYWDIEADSVYAA